MKRNGAPLTDNKKLMIVNIYNYFSNDNSKTDDHHKLTLHKRVAKVLEVCERTVASVISDWRSHSDNTFTLHKTFRRPKLKLDENLSELLRTKILDSNKKAEQLSTPILRQFLSENGYELSKWKLLWSPNNVAYHCRYLRFCFANLESNNDVPHRSEVFLDKSYCHLHHTLQNTWIPHQGVILASGHSPLVVIFRAIVIFRNGSSNKLYGELVPNFVYIWNSTIKPSTDCERKRNDAEE
ncbi:unnamed protein product [Rhizophagus irregularis]|uniref:Uncharacterized protein n=1 Tax=Rhizophagus irregularis TaxID=588596 RepID=A0A2N1MJA5_9GLOM|nr:hypothetical protein RhiirC2_791425 [Rhizophagus irregularis]CAB4397704.1 unnamed protein product [Rhizophagus irregularis]CAB5376552.1 unnamed protein product [Rhizophagus irregularis]